VKEKSLVVAVLLVLLIVFNILNLVMIISTTEHIAEKAWKDLTGDVTLTATASLCIGQQPSITDINEQEATVDEAFTYQVVVSTLDTSANRTYYDNTSLFAINQSGYISFTPGSSDVGNHTILLTVQDYFNCIQINNSKEFNIVIAAAEGGTTPAPSTGGATSGGGGGGDVPRLTEKENPSFDVSDTTLKATVKESQKAEKSITITNDGNTNLDFSIRNIPSFIELAPDSFSLAAGETREVRVIFNPDQNLKPNIYVEVIEVVAGGITEDIGIVLQVESEELLFDGSIDLEDDRLSAGDLLQSMITISGILPGKATVIYTIISSRGIEIYSEEEELILEQQISFAKNIRLPENIPPGKYIFGMKIISGDSFATSTESFTIEGPVGLAGRAFDGGTGYSQYISYSLLGLMALILSLIIIGLIIVKKKTSRRGFRVDEGEPVSRYITEMMRRGYGEEQVYQALVSAGWSPEVIKKEISTQRASSKPGHYSGNAHLK